VQISLDLSDEVPVHVLLRVQQQAVALERLLAVGHQPAVVLPFEQAGNLAGRKQRVHALQESGVQHVRL